MIPRVVRSLVVLSALVAARTWAAPSVAEELFVRKIHPLLQAKCVHCHGEDELKGGLDVRTRAALLSGGDSGQPAIVPGNAERSPLYLAVTREHDDWEPMPPKWNDRLTEQQVQLLREWIAGGAPWPDHARAAEIAALPDRWAGASDGITVRTSGGLSSEWTNRHYKPEDLWAYYPLKKPALPTLVAPRATAKTPPAPTGVNPVDAFIGARLAAIGLAPAPTADRRTLIRRATFDLLGLPPTPDEIAEFVADPDADDVAFARVIDRLLASPHYGEQAARHWLDVVRYADSSGFANDYARGNAWRYRDYVVRAFNADKPYDEFIREQIAGDEIVESRAAAGETVTGARAAECLVATGFLRMGPWELTGMEVAKVARQRFLDDVTDSVGQVFLAHPLQCARCHDHKFDPIPTRDYYALQAAFATTQMAERPAEFLPAENTRGFEERTYLHQREEHYRAILKRLDAKSIAAARAWYAERHLDASLFEQVLEEAVGRKKNNRGRDAGYAEARAALMRRGIPEEQVPPKLAGFAPEDFGLERIARKGLERLKWEYDRYEPLAFAVYAGRTPDVKTVTSPQRMPAERMTAGDLERTHILRGGDPFADGETVAPGVLSAVAEIGEMDAAGAKIPDAIVGRRLALAEWIASPQNPLTARVVMNRIWQWHFGEALAGNPNNFGATGKKPTHPELLDWLAATLVDGSAPGANARWSLKAMHRLIMTSEAYRRSTVHPDPKALTRLDPQGTSLAVFKPRRLAAEELRDAMLAVSGELNPTLGGIPVRPEMNREAALQPRQVMGTFAEAWQPSPRPEQRHRRSLYALRLRGQPDPFLDVFNAPNPELSCEARSASTVTPQVFALFNSEASLARAVAFAARLERETTSREAAISRAFMLAFGREPKSDERQRCLAHWRAMLAKHSATTAPRAGQPREVVREAVEENTGEKFAFSEPLEVAADFVPDLGYADVSPETRALADVCLVLFNTNEFAYVY